MDVPEEERTCSCCGKPFKHIGDERSEQLHFRPISFYIVVQVLLKYIAACDCSDKRRATAESPIKPIDKGLASTSLVAAIAVMKFADHTPLARQATQVFKRSGIELSQSSMCRWMAKAADLLEPVYNLMCELILLSYCFGIDATNVKYREPGVKGKCKTGFVVYRKIPATNGSGFVAMSGSSTGMQRPCVAGEMALAQAWKAS